MFQQPNKTNETKENIPEETTPYKLSKDQLQKIGDNDEPNLRNTEEFISLINTFTGQNKLIYGGDTRSNIIVDIKGDGNCWI